MKPMRTLRTHARTLAMASMLALAVVGLPAVQAHAQPRGGGGMGFCYSPNSGDDTIYFPGQTTVNDEGRLIRCEADGSWTVLRFTLPGHRLPVAPRPIGAVIAP